MIFSFLYSFEKIQKLARSLYSGVSGCRWRGGRPLFYIISWRRDLFNDLIQSCDDCGDDDSDEVDTQSRFMYI